jgi:hypothetical protein
MRFSSFQGLICSAICTTIEFMSDKKLGVSQAAVLELAIRELAQRENVK